MKLKKIMVWIMMAVMMIVIVGCENNSDEQQENSSKPISTVNVGELPEDVQEIVKRGVLRVGVKNSVEGFGYQDPITNEFTGLEVSLGKDIADYLGIDVEYTAVTAATRTELLDSGDIDCVYHFALYELIRAVNATGSEDASETLKTLVQGKRLKDISDLPLDLAV